MNNLITNRQIRQKEELIELLRKTPIIQIACERTAIGRATYYRWRKDDPEFAKKADSAINEGDKLVSDLAESHLISLIKENNLGAIKFWLSNHHDKYATKIEITNNQKDQIDNLSDKQKELLAKALTMTKLLPGDVKNENKNNDD